MSLACSRRISSAQRAASGSGRLSAFLAGVRCRVRTILTWEGVPPSGGVQLAGLVIALPAGLR
jgi:hypothetical protein